MYDQLYSSSMKHDCSNGSKRDNETQHMLFDNFPESVKFTNIQRQLQAKENKFNHNFTLSPELYFSTKHM